jgi:hypothetical protein
MIDANKIDLKKEIEEQIKLTGKERAVDIKFLVRSVKRRWGDEGHEKIIKELEKNGYKMPDSEKYSDMEWIPWSLVTIYFLAMIKIFNLKNDDVIEIARGVATSPSTIVKVFVKYFIKPENSIKFFAKHWKRIYSEGELVVHKFDSKKKEIILHVKNFKRHPYTCIWDMAAVGRGLEIATGWKIIDQTETKCIFRGDPYHEFTYRLS